MTILSPVPSEYVVQPEAPAPRWRRVLRSSRRRNAAIGGGVAVLLVAGLLGGSYESSPGSALWSVDKTVFPGHAQDVALTAVVNDLKKAQDILGSGQQPTPDQLTDARTALNQAKQDLEYLSPSPQRTSLQNLYLQLTQQLLQYTPASVQQLPALPAPTPAPQAADPGSPPQAPDVALMSATAPTWGYPNSGDAGTAAAVDQMSDNFVPPPADVPAAPAADWPQPADPPLTPNLQDLGYYDPSWGQLYNYNPTDWYNYDLSGYNQYGYDVLGFNRWGYDRSGYDRWGYDHWGYNWAGYNWSGYDRDGWDRNGCNEWGQRRDHPDDPRNQDWYNSHHPYEQYYQWKFQNDDPVYDRTQWDQAHGVNPNEYQNWNLNRDWHDPRNRDWAPPAVTVSATQSVTDKHASSSVVNLNASLAQFVSNSTATSTSGPSMKDLANKSARDFTKDLTAATTTPAGAPSPSTLGQRPATAVANHQISLAPPALTAPVPTAPPSKVAPGFTAPKLAPVPVPGPTAVAKPQGKLEPAPASTAPTVVPNPAAGLTGIAPKTDSPNPAVVPPAEPKPAAQASPAVVPPHEALVPDQPNSVPPAPEAPAHPVAPVRQEPPQQQSAPEPPAQPVPAPRTEAPAPAAPVRQPLRQPPVPEAPVRQEAPAPAAVTAPQPPVRQAPPVHEAPPPAPEPAPPVHEAPPPAPPVHEAPPPAPPVHEAPPPAPEPRPAPAPPRGSPKCSTPICPPA
ncbi:MAG: hypothetical protein P4L48_14200 [Mycobacterium sp.]|nr:hypothetical protein [Mycobacterium sp.]